MKISDITLGRPEVIRDTKDIYPSTIDFFASAIPSIPLAEKKLDKTSFHIAVKKLDVGYVFELYVAESLCFSGYCCTRKEDAADLIEGMKPIGKKLGLKAYEPSTDFFLYTIALPSADFSATMLAGEIGFYIWHRIYQLSKEK